MKRLDHPYRFRLDSSSSSENPSSSSSSSSSSPQMTMTSPIPVMPSPLFQELATSQLELLASALQNNENQHKIRSMALYLPSENAQTGQLEFVPAVLVHPSSPNRVFIAGDSDSGMAPTPLWPQSLTKLPGFAHATSLLPQYPMVHSSATNAGVGLVEEVLCDVKTGATALSVPLFSGSQTVGVLLVSPNPPTKNNYKQQQGTTDWTESDRQIVAKTAQSLSLALSMDSERTWLREEHKKLHSALSDSLHQFKNPLQALRTYGKLLQRRILATQDSTTTMTTTTTTTNTPQILELAEHLMVQSDRLVERLKPVDAIVDSMSEKQTSPSQRWLALNPAKSIDSTSAALVPFRTPSLLPPSTTSSSRSSKSLLPQQIASQSQTTWTSSTTTISSTAMDERSYLWLPVSTFESRPQDGMTSSSSQNTGNMESSSSSSSSSSTSSASLLVDDIDLEMSFVVDVLEPILEAFRAIAIDQGIKFDIVVENADDDELPGVMVHPQALQEVVTNLLDNAFRYVVLRQSPSNENSNDPHAPVQPQVRIRFLPNNHRTIGAGVTILIEDNGLGISVEDREAVFERGVRMAAEHTDGSGIGLDIARSLTHRMGGTLRVVDNHDPYQHCLEGAILELVLFRQPSRTAVPNYQSSSATTRNAYAPM
jgi:signal transduction histidine kinase